MVPHVNMCGPLPLLRMKTSIMANMLSVPVFIHLTLLKESSPALLVITTTVKLAAEHDMNSAITLTILSGMVRGVRERTSAVTEEDRGSVSNYLNQLKMILNLGCVPTVLITLRM